MMLTKRVICLMLLLTSGSAYSGDLAGQAGIIDGDTLEIHGTRIRLWGIDAPESSQLCRGDDSLQYRCGAKAANAANRITRSPRRGRLKQTFYQFDSGRIGRTPVPTVDRTACDQANLVHCLVPASAVVGCES